MFFNKKENEAEEVFKKQLETVANDPAVKANAALSKLLEAAVKKAEKSESIRSIASNLDTQLDPTSLKTNCQRPLSACNWTWPATLQLVLMA